ncbi:hypothetical protein AF335_25895 [Streptomyces eurocidicus]|uniref:Aromatic ring-opening dioxygenase LigA n=1 Tax=Streptomyces eurocidicus TaxID=66423 RepID=A0A2N8NRY5_STREU|nr:hypothetical protein AF335_25895 [Streptomyces eurocidicus]
MGVLAAAGSAGAAGQGRGASALPVYRMAAGAQEVRGSGSATGGPLLRPGSATYTDSVRPGERKYYSVELDAGSSAYVSAVAVPRPGATMGTRDGIDVVLEDASGTPCGAGRHRTFLSAGGAYPVADYAERVVRPGAPCGAAGTYRFAVARGDATGGDSTPVPVELRYETGPAARAGDTTASSGAWSSQPPPRSRRPAADVVGGSGFNDATDIRAGSWKDELRPGETRFYRVEVGAGRQLFASARFGGAGGDGTAPYVISGVRLGLNNAARGYVLNKTAGYQGRDATLSLATPPAGAGGSGGGGDAVRGMRLAGWYYLQVSLNPRVGRAGSDAVPVTLDVDLADAGVSAAPSVHKLVGGGAAAGGGGGVLRVVGYVGVGVGSGLLLGLGVWTVRVRRG